MVSDTPISWDDAVSIIERNALGELYRSHETTNSYHAYKASLKAIGESVVDYIIRHRLKWVKPDGQYDLTPLKPLSLFGHPNDCKIIRNDFPYNFTSDIQHVCVWTKVPICSDPESEIGDVSEETRTVIERYVHQTFVLGLGLKESDVIWFRNFPALQSVSELSHVHVLIRGVQAEIIDQLVGTAGVVSE